MFELWLLVVLYTADDWGRTAPEIQVLPDKVTCEAAGKVIEQRVRRLREWSCTKIKPAQGGGA